MSTQSFPGALMLPASSAEWPIFGLEVRPYCRGERLTCAAEPERSLFDAQLCLQYRSLHQCLSAIRPSTTANHSSLVAAERWRRSLKYLKNILNEDFSETGTGVGSQPRRSVFLAQIVLGNRLNPEAQSSPDRQKLHLKVQTYAGCGPYFLIIL